MHAVPSPYLGSVRCCFSFAKSRLVGSLCQFLIEHHSTTLLGSIFFFVAARMCSTDTQRYLILAPSLFHDLAIFAPHSSPTCVLLHSALRGFQVRSTRGGSAQRRSQGTCYSPGRVYSTAVNPKQHSLGRHRPRPSSPVRNLYAASVSRRRRWRPCTPIPIDVGCLSYAHEKIWRGPRYGKKSLIPAHTRLS